MYSVGATMLRCISGIAPPGSTTRHSSISDDEPDPLTGFVEPYKDKYSGVLLETIDWCMQLNSKDRPQNVRQVQDKLLAIFDEESIDPVDPQEPDIAAADSPASKPKPIMAIAALALCALATVGVVSWLLFFRDPGVDEDLLAQRMSVVKENEKQLIESGTVLSSSEASDLGQMFRRIEELSSSKDKSELPSKIESLITRQQRLLERGDRAFLMGSTNREIQTAFNECNRVTEGGCVENWFDIEKQRKVKLSPFEIDPAEVTFSQFEEFVNSTSHTTDAEKKGYSRRELPDATVVKLQDYTWKFPQGSRAPGYRQFIDHPVVHVSFDDAERYCEHNNKRLPSRGEWEYAAMSTERRLYSSYYNPDAETSWTEADLINSLPSQSQSLKDSNTGIHGLTGNVWEWVDTPQPGFNSSRITKGGSWNETSSIYLRSTAIRPQRKDWSFIDLGFRCVRDIERWPM